jgi:cytoskeletal protein RodZ
MKISGSLQAGLISSVLVLALLLNSFAYAAAQETTPAPTADPQLQNAGVPQSSQPPEPNPPAPSTTTPNSTQPANDQLPNSPGTSQAQSEQAAAPPPAQSQAQPQPQSQNRPHEPVGTAAAETVPTSGIAASRPAGSALAPAKQRRIRSILIKTGALVGVVAAVGITMALSQGSPSKPPGAR